MGKEYYCSRIKQGIAVAFVKRAGKTKSLKTSKTLDGLQKQIANYYALPIEEIQIFG